MTLTLLSDSILTFGANNYFSVNSSKLSSSSNSQYNNVAPAVLQTDKIAFCADDNAGAQKILVFVNPDTDSVTTFSWIPYNYLGLDLGNSNIAPSVFHVVKHPNGAGNSFFIVGIGYRNVSGPAILDCYCISQEFDYDGNTIGTLNADVITGFPGPDNYAFQAINVNPVIDSGKVKFIIGLYWFNSSLQAMTAAVKVDPGLLIDFYQEISRGYNPTCSVLLDLSDSIYSTFASDWPIGISQPQARGFSRTLDNLPIGPAVEDFFSPQSLTMKAFARSDTNFNVLFYLGDAFTADGTPVYISVIEANDPNTLMTTLTSVEWLPAEVGVFYQGAFLTTNDELIGVFENNGTKFIQQIDASDLSVIGSLAFDNNTAFYQVTGASLDSARFFVFSDDVSGFLRITIYGTEPIIVINTIYISDISFIVSQPCQPCAPILVSTRRDNNLGV